MSQVISFKCPSCGGYLVFDPAKQRFQCPYCGGSFAENELKEQSEQRQQAAEQARSAEPNSELRSYHCQMCGAEIVTDTTTAATRCYYCHSPVVLNDRLTDEFRPDGVIPFKLDKKAAKAKLQEKYAQSAKRLQEQNAAYTKFCTDNDLKPYHERLAVAGWDRSAASTASAAVREQKRVDKMIADFNAEHVAKDPAELLPKYEYAHGVKEKLLNYSLNMKEGASGRDKAVVFQAALGYNANNYELLMQEIMAGIGRYKASGKTTTEHGEKFTVRMLVKGANGRYVPIRTGWIIAPEDRTPRMTTAFVDR